MYRRPVDSRTVSAATFTPMNRNVTCKIRKWSALSTTELVASGQVAVTSRRWSGERELRVEPSRSKTDCGFRLLRGADPTERWRHRRPPGDALIADGEDQAVSKV